MPAARLLPLARTRRWAMVGVGTRKAWAISSVESPPSVRSVSATCASGASAGRQALKTRAQRVSGAGAVALTRAEADTQASAVRVGRADRRGGGRRLLEVPCDLVLL